MKTPDEIKKGLECCPGQYSSIGCGKCPYSIDGRYCGRNGDQPMKDALAYIQQLEANYQQVSKALCGKENATLDEVFQAVVQVNAELEAVKLERDYLLKQIKETDDFDCMICPLVCRLCNAEGKFTGEQCMKCRIHTADSGQHDGFHFAGVPEKTEVQE